MEELIVEEGASIVNAHVHEDIPDFSIGNGSYSDSELQRRGYSSDDSVEEEKDAMDTFCNRVAATSIKKEGNQAFRHGNFVRAWRCYTAAIHLDPTEMIYFLNRAATHYKTGDMKNCILDCQQSVRVGQVHGTNPRLVAKAHVRCGRAQMRLGQGRAAENSIADALALSPHSTKARTLWIQLHHRQMRTDRIVLDPDNSASSMDDNDSATATETDTEPSLPAVERIPLPAAPAGSALSAIRSPRFERTTEYAEIAHPAAADTEDDDSGGHRQPMEDETSDVDSCPEWDEDFVNRPRDAASQHEAAVSRTGDGATSANVDSVPYVSSARQVPNAANTEGRQQSHMESARIATLSEESAREADLSDGNIQLNASVLQCLGEESDILDDDDDDSLDNDDSAPEEMMSDVDSEPRFGYDSDNDTEPTSAHSYANHVRHDSCGSGSAILTWQNARQRHYQGSLPDPGRPGQAAVAAALEDFNFQNMASELGLDGLNYNVPGIEDTIDVVEDDRSEDHDFNAKFEDDGDDADADDEADDELDFEFYDPDGDDEEDLCSCSDADCEHRTDGLLVDGDAEIQDDSNELNKDEQYELHQEEGGYSIHINGYEENNACSTRHCDHHLAAGEGEGEEAALGAHHEAANAELSLHLDLNAAAILEAMHDLGTQDDEGEVVSPLRSNRSARTYSNLSMDSISSCASCNRLREGGKNGPKFVRPPRPLTCTELTTLKTQCHEKDDGLEEENQHLLLGGTSDEKDVVASGDGEPSYTSPRVTITPLPGGDAMLEERIKADLQLVEKVSAEDGNISEASDIMARDQFAPFADRIFSVFSSPSALCKSFPVFVDVPLKSARRAAETTTDGSGAEDEAKAMTAAVPSRFAHAVDVDEVHRAYECIYSCSPEVELRLLQALELLCMRLSKGVTRRINCPQTLQQIIIVLCNRRLPHKCYQDIVVPKICSIICQLQREEKECLIRWWKQCPYSEMVHLVALMNLALTFQLRQNGLCDETHSVLRVLELLNCANDISGSLSITAFYNKTVNDEMDLAEDYSRWRASGCHSHMWMSQQWRLKKPLSICNFPFILDPAAKAKIFHIDAAMQMQGEVEAVFLQSVFSPTQNPFLVLRIRRLHIVSDALQQLAACRAEELKRPLKVHFEGEEGIDEGGVQKEFFQIIIRELFDVNFGMFEVREDSDFFTFNPHSYESDAQFQLIGTVLGLALYNGVILDVRFPRYVYRKLMGISPNLDDLAEVQPDVAKGLSALLDFEGDVEETFMQSFTVNYDYFGEIRTVELKPDGAELPVTNENRDEFVALFVQHKLQESVHR
jgi:hypothetical protein